MTDSSTSGSNDRPAEHRTGDGEHDPQTCPHCRIDALVGDEFQTDADVDEFERDLSRLLMFPQSASSAYERGYGDLTRTDPADPSPAAMLHLELGFDGPDPDEHPGARQLFNHYVLFGDDRLGGSRAPIRYHLRAPLFAENAGQKELFDTLRDARFLVVETEGGRPAEVEPVTGLREDEPFDVLELLDPRGETVVGDGLYAGWLVEWREIPFVAFATRAPEGAADRLRDLAEARHWGASRDEFRRIDYEADVLSAFCAPEAGVVDRPEGRALRGPAADADVLGPPSAVRHLFDRFHELGVPAEDDDLPWPFALAEATDAEAVDRIRDAVDWVMDPDPDPEARAPGTANLAVEELRVANRVQTALQAAGIETLDDLARLTPVEVLQIENIGPSGMEQIQHCLHGHGRELGESIDDTGEERTGRIDRHFDGDDFLDWIGLNSDGRLEPPDDVTAPEEWRDHPIGLLDLPTAFVDDHDLHEDWSIDYALDRAGEALDEDAEQRLHEAAELHRVRLRWLAILEHWSRPTEYRAGGFDRPLNRPSLHHYLAGLRRYFTGDLAERPVDELPEPESAGFKGRLSRNIDFAGDELRVSDLPDGREALESVSGIGEATAEATYEAVEQMIHQWPGDVDDEGPGLEERRRASEKVAEGLDELDDLFA